MDQGVLVKSKWLVPVTSPPIRDGYLVLNRGKITQMGRISDLKKRDFQRTIDCSHHIVMPGLINPHAHLELSGLKGKIEKGLPFTEWIRCLTNETLSFTEEDYTSSINRGIDELISSGITAVGDISRTGLSFSLLEKRGLRGTVFLEVLGFDPAIERERMAEVKERILSTDLKGKIKPGISPHAPYSVSPFLFKESYQTALEEDMPVAVHCSETEEELEFIEKGQGHIKNMLLDFGVWDSGWTAPRLSPVAYLHKIGVLKGIIAIHLNLLRNGDLELLHKNEVGVVSCQGTNRWFQREKICPIDLLMQRGINVALGTDSLASNDSLNLFFEMRLAKKYFPKISYQELIEMVTIRGARVLGIDKTTGSIEAGKAADIIAIDISGNEAGDPNACIVDYAKEIDFIMIEGKEIFSKNSI